MRRERVFRDRSNLLEIYNNEDFIGRFRLPKEAILSLTDELAEVLSPATSRSHSIPAVLQVCTALKFYATGTFLNAVGDTVGLSKASVSRAVYRVSRALSNKLPQFPNHLAELNKANIKRQFAAMYGFPNVIGAIDCTHIVNRKHVLSINVQVVCEANMIFTNVVARWPGSTHDSFIVVHSSVGNRLEAGAVRDGWLLGDSGYPLRRWLLTPFPNPQSAEQMRYNDAHTRARSVVERAIGLLKCRWCCFDVSGGRLLYQPKKVRQIIMACAILHNMAQRNGVALPPDLPYLQHEEPDPHPPPQHERHHQGARIREEVMQHF
ncbi:hypothetical protein PO909_029375 [Leuciscus waleckii]